MKKEPKCRQITCKIRVTKKARERLHQIAIKRGISMQDLVDELSTGTL